MDFCLWNVPFFTVQFVLWKYAGHVAMIYPHNPLLTLNYFIILSHCKFCFKTNKLAWHGKHKFIFADKVFSQYFPLFALQENDEISDNGTRNSEKSCPIYSEDSRDAEPLGLQCCPLQLRQLLPDPPVLILELQAPEQFFSELQAL